MKKRIMAAIIAVSVMMFGTTAFAAGSPSADSTKLEDKAAGQIVDTSVEAPTEKADSMAKTTTVSDNDVKVVAVADTTVTEAVTATKNLLQDVKKLGDKLGNKDLADAATATNKGVIATVLSVVNLQSTATNKEVVIKNKAIKANKTYAVLHYTNGAWETIPATVKGDGELTFKVSNFSPFAIVEIDLVDKSATATGSKPSVTTPSTTPAAPAATPAADNKKADQAASPKTGETMPVAVLALLVCATGAVVCAKKKEN